MNLNTFYIALIALAWSLLSCKKEVPDAVAGTTNVSISFNSPNSNDIISVGEEFHIEGIIDADAMMGGWQILIINSENDTVVEYLEPYEQTQYIFHYHWFPTPTDTGANIVRVDALDKSLNSLESKSVSISCQ
jgi:hypothetical protein